MIDLNIPFPPSANALWRSNRGRVHKSRKYVDWLLAAGLKVRSQKPGKIEGQYKISIQAVRPDKRRRDLDNALKPVSDLLKSLGVIEDDSLCEMITARWVTYGEGIYVRIEPAGVE
jgi:crossover junction endodeoxyribonuclease RusA